ncbi:MAG: hypothetical protein ACJAYY_003068 [Paraglaciecola sp.]|jgi:hypothetical protein|uniref:hypothetical protein n=1 Tax=Polaribacter sp. TaxID=1920175 RepID=UPI003ABFB098
MEQNFKLLPIFILILCFISCDNDHLETTTITGFSQPKNYEKGTFTWEFNMNTKTVTIINTAAIYNTLYIPSFINNREGVNPFEIVEENSMNFLAVENRKGAIKLEQNKLTLDYGIAQGDMDILLKDKL